MRVDQWCAGVVDLSGPTKIDTIARGTYFDRHEGVAVCRLIRPPCVSSMPKALLVILCESQLEVIADGPRKNYV